MLEEPVNHQLISDVYGGNAKIIHLLRKTFWGPELLNLGYHPWYMGLGRLLYGVQSCSTCQRKLINHSIKLLHVKKGDHVLDIACGRGGSTFMLCHSTQAASVHGIDLLPENIEIAQRIFPACDGLTYQQGDAQNLEFPDESFHKVMCCEAAFHFPDRGKFLSEAERVLKPGGRLVVVDFVWRTPKHRECRKHELGKIVRKVWEWDDMSSECEYRSMAASAGLHMTTSQDWTNPVTRALQHQAENVVWLRKRSLGRWLLNKRYPMISSFTEDDWAQIELEVRAHRFLLEHTYYKAMVFTKVR